MSVATDKQRIEGAKTGLASWLTENGVTVPSGAKLDALVDLLSDVEAGGGVTEPYIKETLFYGTVQTAELHGYPSVRASLYSNSSNLTTVRLCDEITIIEVNAFSYCTKLSDVNMPSALKRLDTNAFYGCTSLTAITFKSNMQSIASSAFGGCTNLTTINVPWSQGAVAGAPWGATNAAINYNYTGG